MNVTARDERRRDIVWPTCSSGFSISLSGRRENITPDYPLTLLEGLTAITHYCLLDNKRVRNVHLLSCKPYICTVSLLI